MGVDELEQLARRLGVGVDLQVGHELRLGRVVFDARIRQGRASGDEVRGIGNDLKPAALVDDLFGSGLENGHENVVFRHPHRSW